LPVSTSDTNTGQAGYRWVSISVRLKIFRFSSCFFSLNTGL